MVMNSDLVKATAEEEDDGANVASFPDFEKA
jgi:hypothetical protein